MWAKFVPRILTIKRNTNGLLIAQPMADQQSDFFIKVFFKVKTEIFLVVFYFLALSLLGFFNY